MGRVIFREDGRRLADAYVTQVRIERVHKTTIPRWLIALIIASLIAAGAWVYYYYDPVTEVTLYAIAPGQVQQAPDPDAPVLEHFKPGKSFMVLDNPRLKDWVKISGSEAYIARKYLKERYEATGGAGPAPDVPEPEHPPYRPDIPRFALRLQSYNLPPGNGGWWARPDLFSEPDLYADVSWNGNVIFRTTTVADNAYAIWNETTAAVGLTAQDTLTVRVLDEDVTVDEALGAYAFPVQERLAAHYATALTPTFPPETHRTRLERLYALTVKILEVTGADSLRYGRLLAEARSLRKKITADWVQVTRRKAGTGAARQVDHTEARTGEFARLYVRYRAKAAPGEALRGLPVAADGIALDSLVVMVPENDEARQYFAGRFSFSVEGLSNALGVRPGMRSFDNAFVYLLIGDGEAAALRTVKQAHRPAMRFADNLSAAVSIPEERTPIRIVVCEERMFADDRRIFDIRTNIADMLQRARDDGPSWQYDSLGIRIRIRAVNPAAKQYAAAVAEK
jgi:hypothetical protein